MKLRVEIVRWRNEESVTRRQAAREVRVVFKKNKEKNAEPNSDTNLSLEELSFSESFPFALNCT